MWRSHNQGVGLLKMGHTNMGIRMAMRSGPWSSQKMANTWQPAGKTTLSESGQSCPRKKNDRRTRRKKILQRKQARVSD